MKNFVIINGVNSNTINGLGINELPPISKPSMRVLTEEIDGRDGDITTPLGYSAYDKTFTIGLFGTGYDINDIISFFNDSGTIVFSNEPDKYYNYKTIAQIDYESLLKFKSASITIHCQPFKYPTEEEEQEIEYEYVEATDVESATLNNTTTAPMSISLKGNTSQIQYSGKNFLDVPTPFSITGTLIKALSLPSGNYVLSFGKWSSSTTNPYSKIEFIYQDDTTESQLLNNSTSGIYNFTFSQNVKSVKFYSNTTDGNSPSITATYTNMMLSTNGGDYEPYVGGIPSPNPDYPQEIHSVTGDNEIVVCGKNLFSLENANVRGWDCYILNPLKTIGDYAVSCVNDYPVANKGVALAFASELDNVDGGYFCGYVLGASSKSVVHYVTESQANAKYLVIRSSEVTNINNLNSMEIMLEKNSEATTYEPYQSQTYPINLGGKNLLQNKATSQTINQVQFTVYEDGSVKANGTPNGNAGLFLTGASNEYVDLKIPNGTYKLSGSTGGASDMSTWCLYMSIKHSNNTYDTVYCYDGEITFTKQEGDLFYVLVRIVSGVQANNLMFYPMISKAGGEYKPYTTPIELCKIGDYQDYFYKDSGKWYLHKEIGKVVLDGTESWSYDNTYHFFLTTFSNAKKSAANLDILVYSDNFKGEQARYATNPDYDNIICINTNGYTLLRDSDYTSAANFKTWLGTHNTKVKYVLATPTNNEITDTTLISQLEAIYRANSYVTQTNNDKPFIIDVSAMKKGSNEVEIENIGNYVAKPTLDIKGTGIVHIYKDNVEILQVDLTSNNEIVIDNMEAYEPSTNQLMNRKVTGNYDNITAPSGTCVYKVTGDLTKMTISNYTRYL